MTENEDSSVDWQELDVPDPPENGDKVQRWQNNLLGLILKKQHVQEDEIGRVEEARRKCWAARLGRAWPLIATAFGGLAGAGGLVLLGLKIAHHL